MTIHAGCCARPSTLTMCGEPGETDHNSMVRDNDCPACEAFYMDETKSQPCPHGFDCAKDGKPVTVTVSFEHHDPN